MTSAGMAVLRLSATLAHALPGVRLHLRHGRRALLTVARPPVEAMAPCAFRRVVARAHEQRKAGLRLGFMDLPDGVDPAVDTGVPADGHVFPSGMHRVRVGDVDVHAFATTLSAEHCQAVLDEGWWGDVRLHVDAATEVTLVHVLTPADAVAAGPPAALENLLARLLADEVVHEVVGSSA